LLPSSEKATIEGVVLEPSAFSIIFGSCPLISTHATQLFVVPKSIPMIREKILFVEKALIKVY